MKLKIADDLSLPVDVVTQTIAVLAKRRAGKSYTMRRLVEQLVKAGQQIALVDPKGDQWGIRSAADGKAPGLPIVILGGERADVPLEASSGEVVAKLVVEERVSILLDLSLFRKHEVATFMTGFLEHLYRLKAREIYRTPLMLVIDEADAVAPQKPQKGEERMLGAAEDIVRRGGQRGIGCVLVTQRSAVLNKNVLTQAQVLIAMRTIAPQDLAAMNAWIDVHGTEEQKRTLMESLPSLPVGDAWVWSPGWPTVDGIFKRVHVLPIETFDSGATPKPGEKRAEPKQVADVDLEALKRQMSATIEKAKADDPRELRRQIAELKKQLATPNSQLPTQKVVEKPVLKDGQISRLEKLYERIFNEAERHAKAIDLFWKQQSDESKALLNVLAMVAGEQQPFRPADVVPIRNTQATMTQRVDRQVPVSSQGRRVAPAAATSRPASLVSPSSNGSGPLKGMHRAMLTALAQHPDGLSKKKILIHTGYASSGPVSTAFADLVREGWADNTGSGLRITDGGVRALGSYEPLPIGDALREYLLTGNKLSGMEKALLREVCAAYPESIRKGDVLEKTGYASSGPVSSAFAKLVGLGYAVSQGSALLRATDELFD